MKVVKNLCFRSWPGRYGQRWDSRRSNAAFDVRDVGARRWRSMSSTKRQWLECLCLVRPGCLTLSNTSYGKKSRCAS